MAEHSLFLEHGCEKTHNEYMRGRIMAMGMDPAAFGWASIQMDGGIDASLEKVTRWFEESAERSSVPESVMGGLADLHLGLASVEPVNEDLAAALALITVWVVNAGGTVVVPQNSSLLASNGFVDTVLGDQAQAPTLAYGATATEPGFHIMETPTAHWVETLTGLGATGVESVVAAVATVALQTHPLVPVIQVAAASAPMGGAGSDADVVLDGDPSHWPDLVLERVVAVAAHEYTPKLYKLGNVDFQITRGLLGVSM
jgi:altronate dehydratase